MKQSNGRNVINTIHKCAHTQAHSYAAQWCVKGGGGGKGIPVTGTRPTMMSHFGHEAIFTLDYTINENQMSDCLMPRETEIEREPEREREGDGLVST